MTVPAGGPVSKEVPGSTLGGRLPTSLLPVSADGTLSGGTICDGAGPVKESSPGLAMGAWKGSTPGVGTRTAWTAVAPAATNSGVSAKVTVVPSTVPSTAPAVQLYAGASAHAPACTGVKPLETGQAVIATVPAPPGASVSLSVDGPGPATGYSTAAMATFSPAGPWAT